MSLVCIGILVAAGVFLWWTRRYGQDHLQSINKKAHPLWRIYPSALFVVDKFHLYRTLERNYAIEKAVHALEVEKSKKDAEREYLTKKVAQVMAVFLAVQFLVLALDLSVSAHAGWREEYALYRGSQDQTIPLEVTITDTDVTKDSVHHEKLEVPVSAYYGQQQQADAIVAQASDYLKEEMLGENTQASQITKDLVFPEQIPDTDITLVWHTQMESVIDEKGHLDNTKLQENCPVLVYAEVYSVSYSKKYGEKEPAGVYQLSVTVLPREQADYQEWLQTFQEKLEENDQQTVTQEQLELPKNQEGRQVRFYSVEENQAPVLWGIGTILCGLIYYLVDEQTQSKMKKREKQMRIDYPEIINKFALLMSAGMTVAGTWNRMVEDYERVKTVQGRRFAYDEMKLTNRELMLGGSEQQAIERFGMRTGMVEYLKFASLLGQNLKKGSNNLSQMLEVEAIEAFEDRKAMALKLGEEAGTKQLMPMFLMLFLVILIIMVPAYWSMQF